MDIGEVRFHINRPPRVDFRIFRRLHRLMVMQAEETRRRVLSHRIRVFLISVALSLAIIDVIRAPDSALLFMNYGAFVVNAPGLLASFLGSFLLGAATIYWRVLSRASRLIRGVYDKRQVSMTEADFGEYGMRIRWGDSVVMSPWPVTGDLHIEKEVSYLIIPAGVSMAFTVQCFASRAEYDAWTLFVTERLHALTPSP
jgi:hypothetical protein